MIKTTRTRYTDKFYFYGNDHIIGNSLSYYGEYGQLEIDFLLHIINENTIVYDVGANIGYHATAFASKAKKVYSFEPNPHNYHLLKKNTVDLDNVQTINVAVGNTNGTIKIEDFDPNTDNLNYGNMKCGEIGKDIGILRLDELAFEKPDIIKIDVEGYEYQVITGCENLLSTSRPAFYYEAHETKELKEIYEFLNQYDYQLYWCFVRNFNENNFKYTEENIFGNTGTVSVLAFPKILGEFKNLPKVLGPDDHYDRLLKPNEQ